MILEGVVRGIKEKIGLGENQPTLGDYGEALLSQLLPPYAKLVSKIFIIETFATAGVAPTASSQTTGPKWILYNANPENGASLILLSASVALEDQTSALGIGLIVCTALGPQDVVSSDFSGTIKTCADGSPRKPLVFLDDTPTLRGGTPAWLPIAGSFNTTNASTVWSAIRGNVDGLLIAPPKGGFGLDVAGPTTNTVLYAPSFVIAEVKL
ncbi:hypothetical protein LCGC14_1507710 [marine sediment metagenome]|uniref:Uncharacterized protein n=1 Tax=marine sediment metagenome TaxID=412755 RepID=A0A0F9J2D9_9ZZZZ